MTSERNILSPLKFIRIAKDMKMREMAEIFEVTSAYISAIEMGQRKIKKQVLIYGLNDLNINYDDYLELESLSYELSLREDIDDLKKYRIMLIKAIGVVDIDLKEEIDQLLDTYYRSQLVEKQEQQIQPTKKKIRLIKGTIIKKK